MTNDVFILDGVRTPFGRYRIDCVGQDTFALLSHQLAAKAWTTASTTTTSSRFRAPS